MINSHKRKVNKESSEELRLWLDSGANIHVVKISLDEFKDVRFNKLTLNTASSDTIQCNWRGTLGPIRDVYQSDDVSTNLLSVSQLCTDYNCMAVFTSTNVYVYKENTIQTHDSPIWQGHVHNGMYLLHIPLINNHSPVLPMALVVDALVSNSYTNWHRRLNHPSKQYMKNLQRRFPHITWTKEQELGHHTNTCIGCVKGKLLQKAHYSKSRGIAGIQYPVEKPGDLILIDMYFSNLPSRENHYVGIIIVDAFSKCIFSLTAKTKAEASDLFSTWVAECAQLKVQISNLAIVRSDNGGEFIGTTFQSMLRNLHIAHERVPPYSHVNKAERAIRHIKENSRALIEAKRENLQRAALHLTNGHSSNPYLFWSDATSHVCKVSNTMPTGNKHHDTKQYKFFKQEIVSLDRLKVFASTVHVHVNANERQTWDPTAREGIYLGVDLPSPKSYKVLMLDTRKIILSENVIFNENEDSLISNYIPNRNMNTQVSNSDYWYNTDTLRRSTANPSVTLQTVEWTTDEVEASSPTVLSITVTDERYATETSPDISDELLGIDSIDPVPANLAEALRSPQWNESYHKELNSLKVNNILDVVDRPPQSTKVNILNWHYIFKVKVDAFTLAKTYKTRATLRGDRQIYGIDYFETYAPVVRLKSLRIALTTTHHRGWRIHQMDVDTAFLYGVVEEGEPDIYVELPYRYIPKKDKSKVGLLRKHVYGLKQAPRTWFRTISAYLSEIGFDPTISDTCLFTKRVNGQTVCIMSLFVDDVVIMTSNDDIMTDIKNKLKLKWSMKDLGSIKSILGMKVVRNDKLLQLSQTLYIDNILKKFYTGAMRKVETPLDPGTKLFKDDSTESNFPYREILGSLNYLSQCTRPDLTFAVSYLSKYSNCHNATHHKAIMHVLRYLHHTREEGITYSTEYPLEPYGMSDATWGSDNENSRSVSGYIFCMGGGPVCWSSKSQTTVALSSAESEYVATCSAAKEALHLKHVLPELDDTLFNANSSIVIYGDNTACIAIAREPVMHERQKHFDLKLHFVREAIYRKDIALEYIETNLNASDLLTKPSSRQMFKTCLPILRGNSHIKDML